MKKPNIRQCFDGDYPYVVVGNRVIGKDSVSDMIGASINLLSELKDQKLSPDAWVYYNELEEALKKAGCE